MYENDYATVKNIDMKDHTHALVYTNFTKEL